MRGPKCYIRCEGVSCETDGKVNSGPQFVKLPELRLHNNTPRRKFAMRSLALHAVM